uniref:serine/threonine-protein kinase STY46-like n=1 Tax=Erigeron canadensis TaxID=72917 RepID=UPI001CB97075|nr:serine/threonine-protein kinase STY46-like [Erigeron canadensis]
MDLVEGVGESSSPPRTFAGGFSGNEVVNDVYNRLLSIGNDDVLAYPDFREQLEAHFNRLPSSYALDINWDRVEDVLLHQKLLVLAKDPENRPVFHVRLLENFWTRADGDEDQQESSVGPSLSHGGICETDFEPCSKLGDLNLEVRRNSLDKDKVHLEGDSFRRHEDHVPIHEVIFSAVDKPKLLSQLSALLSDIGLNIREAHVFSTTDGYSLDVFVVDGWPLQETQALHAAMESAIARSEGSWSGPSRLKSGIGRALTAQVNFVDTEIDIRLLKLGEKVASGSCGDLHRGVYVGQEVAVKVLRSETLNEALEDEFRHEVAILREVQHRNVVRFIGASTKQPHLCIITEYMPGGSLYEYLHKNHHTLSLPQLVQFAIDVCRGMEYLHKSNIIHRDLKTANLLMDNDNVVKVADFGVARFQNQEGVMTAETGTYRWMAPEVINHQPYDQKADVFSFAIVLWELVTAKIPYDNMTPLQAALGVRQGRRPDLPTNTHPKLLELMQRCWETDPGIRPSFSEIKVELEKLLQEIQGTVEKPNGS